MHRINRFLVYSLIIPQFWRRGAVLAGTLRTFLKPLSNVFIDLIKKQAVASLGTFKIAERNCTVVVFSALDRRYLQTSYLLSFT